MAMVNHYVACIYSHHGASLGMLARTVQVKVVPEMIPSIYKLWSSDGEIRTEMKCKARLESLAGDTIGK